MGDACNTQVSLGAWDSDWYNVYVYNSGIITFNAPLPITGVNLADRSTLGDAFIAPGLITTGTYSVSAFLLGSDISGFPTGDPRDIVVLFSTGDTVFGAEIALGDDQVDSEGDVLVGKVTVSYVYGAGPAPFFPFPSNDPDSFPLPNLPAGAVVGYDAGGQQQWQLAAHDPGYSTTGINGSPGITFDLSQPSAPFGVPEPETWALMIAGAGLTGGVLRRRSRALVRAA
jgi:hypothetical protein